MIIGGGNSPNNFFSFHFLFNFFFSWAFEFTIIGVSNHPIICLIVFVVLSRTDASRQCVCGEAGRAACMINRRVRSVMSPYTQLVPIEGKFWVKYICCIFKMFPSVMINFGSL